jgi:hypothetical protein
MEGIHRLVLEIRARADDIRTFHDDATQAVNRLANPSDREADAAESGM